MNSRYRLINRETGSVVVESLEIADGYWSRFRGLQFRRELPCGSGLLLVPSASVHTCFMRFAIDIIALDRVACVVGVRHHVSPWRIAWMPRETHAILELPGGTTCIRRGERLRAVPPPDPNDPPPRSLAFML